MYRAFFVFLKCTIQGGPKVDVLLIAFLYLWLKFWEVSDKYWIVPVRKLFYFHHCYCVPPQINQKKDSDNQTIKNMLLTQIPAPSTSEFDININSV